MTGWDAPDVVAAHLSAERKLGMNLLVDRIGSHLQIGNLEWDNRVRQPMNALHKRLSDDPAAAAPEKVRTGSPLLQMSAACGANGIEQMAILMNNDAGLPFGTGYDHRTQDDLIQTLQRGTRTLSTLPAFRGRSWSSNWWIFRQQGANAAETPEEKAAYEAALKAANETGAWDPVLEKVSNRRLGYAVEAQGLFNRTMKEITPGLVTAVAAPYRNVESYPPVTFSNVDEVDLHIQWEQIGVPYHSPHNADFYKRPGKRGWAHPEIWNDSGTGDQVMSVLFQTVMRGADGVGCSGTIPPWGHLDDPRIAHSNIQSIYRVLNSFLRQYGPWLATLQNDDRVAIVASGRMFRTDRWCHVMGLHFARLMEAYITCLHAHRPASIIFAEDMTRDSLKRFKAVLVVGQRVEMEPALATAIRAAQDAGVAVFHDGTCREELVRDLTPLGISFDKLEHDPSPAGDDAAYWRFPGYAKANLPALLKALEPIVPPAAEAADDEVLVTQRKSEKGRCVFVVNGTVPRLEPGHLWRMTLALTNRVPMQLPVRPEADGATVYDVFALKQVSPRNGVVQADLRCHPARIFAILPAAIGQVELRGPGAARAGASFAWRVRVLDAAGRPIEASVPVRLRLLGADGAVVDEHFLAAGSNGAGGSMVAPLNGPPGRLTLEAAELFSGKAARLLFAAPPPEEPAALVLRRNAPGEVLQPAPAPPRATGSRAAVTLEVPEATFGPHIRDMVLADGGALAVINTMNWDHNLYAVDTGTGMVRWRQRLGHYFAFLPQALRSGVAVQGFDFESAEGYHLYLVGEDGKPERRFALYGVPKRLPHRFVPGLVQDHVNNFAVPDDASWVASAGDLGLAVWDRSGKLLWSQDWWKNERHAAKLAAPDTKTLLVIEGMHVTAYRAADGNALWELTLARLGDVTKVAVSADTRTCALLTTAEGGRVYVIRNGRVVRALPTSGADLAVNADGSLVAVAADNRLRLYSVAEGLQWTFAGDDHLRFPRFSPDGRRIATTSDLGSVYVLHLEGRTLFERDMGARAVPAWLPGGDLLLGTWMGTVCRLDGAYEERWRALLRPEAVSMRENLLADDGTPTTRVATWSNAERTPSPLKPNLLAETPAIVRFVPSAGWGGWAQLTLDPKLLYDGEAGAPSTPWLNWNYIGFFAETSPFNYLLIDTFRTQLRVTGVTFYEDPKHPESWLRDAVVEYWDVVKEEWMPAMAALSDAAAHTHLFEKPIEAARWRIVMPRGLVGNLRLAEIVFHGEMLGNSHPDVIAKKPVAVLFDEQDDIKGSMMYGNNGLSFKFDDAYAGGRCLQLRADRSVSPLYQPPFGHAVHNWDFEIAEDPAPGQYRYLQFAWKPLESKAGSLTLSLGGARAFSAKIEPDAKADWRAERVDLWNIFEKAVRIQSMRLDTEGASVAVDQILLGRSEDALQAHGKN